MQLRYALMAAAGLLAMPGIAHADDNQTEQRSDPGVWRISTGVNYSQGDYGDVADTKVISAPVAVKYRKGGFFFRVSVPYVHVDGPGSLIDTPQGRDAGFGDDGGFEDGGSNSGSGSSGSSGSGSSGSGSSGSGSSGSSGGSGSSGSGSSGSSGGSGSSGSGSSGSSGGSGSSGSSSGGNVVGSAGADSRRGGIGDIAVTMGYSLDLAETTYLDLTGRMKIPTASRAKRLGTGKFDFTVGADLVQDIGDATLYVGGRRKFVGKPAGSNLRDVWGFGGGLSYNMPGGTVIGADYDWQQASTAGNGASSEVTGWVNFRVSRRMRMQLFAGTGLSTNSADFVGGLTLSYRIN